MSQSPNRILPLDGLRCIAAFGVVWVHVWSAWKNPGLKIFHLDLYRLISIIGNGVDLFFVISGFCMYLMYGSKEFSLDSFWKFIKKRWLRIAPPFYASVIVYALVLYSSGKIFPFFETIMLHFLFLQNFKGVYELSAPFWSLATEWYFYLIIPVMLLGIRKIGFGKTIFILSVISIISGFVYYASNLQGWTTNIWVRLIEFLWGVIVARMYTLNKLSALKSFNKWWVGLAVAYVGRLFILTEVVQYFGTYGVFFKVLGLPVMTLGFAIFMMYLLENQTSILGRFFSSDIMIYFGQISYSLYLWHSLVIGLLAGSLTQILKPFGTYSSLAAFVTIVSITILISAVSCKLFEEPYLKKK